MFKVVMDALYDVEYTVARDLTQELARNIFEYVLSTNKQEYFDDLGIERVSIIDACGAVVVCREV